MGIEQSRRRETGLECEALVSTKQGEAQLDRKGQTGDKEHVTQFEVLHNHLQVLSFECYYKEMVEGSQEEAERHRRSG